MRAVILVFVATLCVAPTLGCDLVPGYTPPTLEELVTPARTAFFGTVVALRMRNGEITMDLPPECGERDPDAPCWQGFWERLSAYHENTVSAVANVDQYLQGTEENQWFELSAGGDNSCGDRLYIGQKVLVVDGQVRAYSP